MQPNARPAEAWTSENTLQAPCSQTVDESRGEKQQEEEISHWMHLQ